MPVLTLPAVSPTGFSGLGGFFGLLFKIHGSRFVPPHSHLCSSSEMTLLPHGCIFLSVIFSLRPLSDLSVRIETSLAGCMGTRVLFKLCSHRDLPHLVVDPVKFVKRSLTIPQNNQEEFVPKKKTQADLKKTCLKARQFRSRRSEQGFAKSSAFKVYRFHFMDQVSRSFAY